MHLSKINECFDHRISGGSDYGWTCFGYNARYLDFESDYAHASVVFDTSTQVVYIAEVSPKEGNKGTYQWIHPDVQKVYFDECRAREIDPHEAWDDVKYTVLETAEDFLEKAHAVFNNLGYDERIDVPLDLDNDVILALALEAHKRDITLNKMVEHLLQIAIDAHGSVNKDKG